MGGIQTRRSDALPRTLESKIDPFNLDKLDAPNIAKLPKWAAGFPFAPVLSRASTPAQALALLGASLLVLGWKSFREGIQYDVPATLPGVKLGSLDITRWFPNGSRPVEPIDAVPPSVSVQIPMTPLVKPVVPPVAKLPPRERVRYEMPRILQSAQFPLTPTESRWMEMYGTDIVDAGLRGLTHRIRTQGDPPQPRPDIIVVMAGTDALRDGLLGSLERDIEAMGNLQKVMPQKVELLETRMLEAKFELQEGRENLDGRVERFLSQRKKLKGFVSEVKLEEAVVEIIADAVVECVALGTDVRLHALRKASADYAVKKIREISGKPSAPRPK